MDADDGAVGEGRGWAVLGAGCGVVGGLATLAGVLVAQNFERVYADLGIRLPLLTELALTPYAHLAAGLLLVLAGVMTLFIRTLAPFIVLLLAYIVLLAAVLWLPLLRVTTVLGTSP